MGLLLAYNVRSLLARRGSTAFTLLGIALTVGVFLALMGLAAGLQHALVATGRPGNAVVLRSGALAEANSAVTRAQVGVLKYAEQIVQEGADPLASPELCIQLYLSRGEGAGANVLIRGVTPAAFRVHDGVRLAEGRLFRPQAAECIVGRAAARRYPQARLGQALKFGKRSWTVVGLFDADGSALESEIWTDADDLLSDYKRENYSSVTVRVASPEALAALARRAEEDPRLGLKVLAERTYYEEQAAGTMQMKALAMTITFLMCFGAVFALMNTLYAAVAQRSREIGTLRALGFSRRWILASFLFEGLLLTLAGGALGMLLAFPANGWSSATMNARSFSEVTFAVRLTPPLLLLGLGFSAFMGVVGGLLPAWSAARLPIVRALREGAT